MKSITYFAVTLTCISTNIYFARMTSNGYQIGFAVVAIAIAVLLACQFFPTKKP